ncbi:hypothetical protein HYT00_00585 [Candidatus Giovannonibacteria bacterium]|nr:hypothetical protein [Candidatus Giovannonibacteria bacterium]
MKKKIIIAVGIIIIAALTGFFLIKNKIKNDNARYKDYTTRASVKALFNMNASQKCTVRPQGSLREGNIFVGGGKLRGDFKTSSSRTSFGHIIMDRENVYTWTDSGDTGAKIPIGSFQLNQSSESFQWKCEIWEPEKSLFELPKNINFSETS